VKFDMLWAEFLAFRRLFNHHGIEGEIVRVIAERVKKAKGDSQDPETWSGCTDYFVCYIGHAKCTESEIRDREYQVEIPGMNSMYGLFDEEDEMKPDLEILSGGKS